MVYTVRGRQRHVSESENASFQTAKTISKPGRCGENKWGDSPLVGRRGLTITMQQGMLRGWLRVVFEPPRRRFREASHGNAGNQQRNTSARSSVAAGAITAPLGRASSESPAVFGEGLRLVALQSVVGEQVHDERQGAFLNACRTPRLLTSNTSDIRDDSVTAASPEDVLARRAAP